MPTLPSDESCAGASRTRTTTRSSTRNWLSPFYTLNSKYQILWECALRRVVDRVADGGGSDGGGASTAASWGVGSTRWLSSAS